MTISEAHTEIVAITRRVAHMVERDIRADLVDVPWESLVDWVKDRLDSNFTYIQIYCIYTHKRDNLKKLIEYVRTAPEGSGL